MKISDILFEGYTDQIQDEVLNLLAIAHARELTSIPVNQLIIDLRKLGYAIDRQSIGEILDNIELVSSHDEKTIKLNGSKEEISDITDIEDIMNMDSETEREPDIDPIDAAALRKSKKDMNI